MTLRYFLFKGAVFPHASLWLPAFWILFTLFLLTLAAGVFMVFRGKGTLLSASLKPTCEGEGVNEQDKRAQTSFHTMLATCGGGHIHTGWGDMTQDLQEVCTQLSAWSQSHRCAKWPLSRMLQPNPITLEGSDQSGFTVRNGDY